MHFMYLLYLYYLCMRILNKFLKTFEWMCKKIRASILKDSYFLLIEIDDFISNTENKSKYYLRSLKIDIHAWWFEKKYQVIGTFNHLFDGNQCVFSTMK